MAKIICCDECKSIKIKETGSEKRGRYTEKEEGFFGMGGCWDVMYHEHYRLYKTYQCEECGFRFEELESSY